MGKDDITLSNEPVKILVVRPLNTQVPTADVVNGLVVNHEAAVRVLERSVRGQDGIIWLDNRCGNLWRWVHAEFKLALLAIVHRQPLHQQRTETRASAASERMEDQEPLQTGAVVRDSSNLVKHLVNQLLADSVMTTSIVVRRVFLPGNHLFGVEEAAVGAGADFVHDIGLEIAVDCARDVFALA